MKKAKTAKRAKASKKKSSLWTRFKSLSATTRIISVIVVLAVVTLAGSLGYSKLREDDFYSLANSSLPQPWAKLYEGNGYTYYLCQQAVNGKLYARGVVVKPKGAAARAISVQTFKDQAMKQAVSHAHNQQGSTYVYWADEISAPSAEIPTNGWVQVMVAGEKFSAAQYFIPPCDDATVASEIFKKIKIF